jgi:hypothetical protein
MSFTAPELSFVVESFAAGWMDSPEQDSLALGATPDGKNGVFFSVQTDDTPRVVLRRRKGCRLINPIAIASGKAIDGGTEFVREAGTSEQIVVCNGTAYAWDGATGYTALTGGTGFTAGNRVHTLQFKDNLFLMDGVQHLRYDGTSCKAVGFIAPTAAPALAIAAGPGVTGTYEGYAVWYDSVIDHESSPSAISVATAFVNQQRQWTKPAGAPPANVDKWRMYVRRTDTNEGNYYLVGTVAIATGTLTESVSDAARTNKGPFDSSNDVPPVFAFAEEFKGYRIGVKTSSSDIYISKQYDPESQHPKDVFPVGGKGDTKALRAVRKYGVDCLLQKPTRTFRLIGDSVPFKIESIDGSYGGVSQKSGVEVDGWWYQWDERRGPYRTNLSAWETLGDTRIATFLSTVNQQALASIDAVHHRGLNLVIWSVPTTSTRRRTLIAFNYKVGRWMTPITGFEFASLFEFTTLSGAYAVYFGDEWGRIYELFSGERDGPTTGDTSATITACTSSKITAATATFYTTGNGLAGMPILTVSPSGAMQWVRCSSNTATEITLDILNNAALAPVPNPASGTWTVYVGAIDWYWVFPRYTGGQPDVKKRGWQFTLGGYVDTVGHLLNVGVRYNRSNAISDTHTIQFAVGGMIWGTGVWGVDVWGAGGSRSFRKHRLKRCYYDIQFKVWNYRPDQPIILSFFKTTADWLPKRLAMSV